MRIEHTNQPSPLIPIQQYVLLRHLASMSFSITSFGHPSLFLLTLHLQAQSLSKCIHKSTSHMTKPLQAVFSNLLFYKFMLNLARIILISSYLSYCQHIFSKTCASLLHSYLIRDVSFITKLTHYQFDKTFPSALMECYSHIKFLLRSSTSTNQLRSCG